MSDINEKIIASHNESEEIFYAKIFSLLEIHEKKINDQLTMFTDKVTNIKNIITTTKSIRSDDSNKDATEDHIGTQRIVLASSKEVLDQQLAFETEMRDRFIKLESMMSDMNVRGQQDRKILIDEINHIKIHGTIPMESTPRSTLGKFHIMRQPSPHSPLIKDHSSHHTLHEETAHPEVRSQSKKDTSPHFPTTPRVSIHIPSEETKHDRLSVP
ncbi:hypothetical protein CROQUDRAFT_137083 [Cronartium quercuum f. sp. fusiforme G11]|uniref:Uncharacterized protein n=1 Tax=Cronartium quercuum f. sp. fusiforme G11 TaxID=708437 RepID=A0A9P6N8W6_9BASI|nr:hypothetical protein CROQUDRAFT_137083 [Cronartium quercuum f. sp. fusiforme G11]